MAEQLLHAVSSVVGALHCWQPVRDVQQVLIYKLDHLGDILLATPALRALRRHYPNATIRMVVGEWSSVVLAHNPNVDELVIYNSPMYARYPYFAHGPSHLRRILSDFDPDLIVSLRDDWTTLRYPFRPLVRRVNRGWVHVHEWIQRRRGMIDRRHEIERIWRVLRPLGIEPEEETSIDYFMTDDERRTATEVMVKRGISHGFAAIHAGTSVPLKEWSLHRFAEIARQVATVYGMQIVLVGSDEEVNRSRELAALTADLEPVDITGLMNIRVTTALLEQAGIYIGSDGGLMHLAALVGVPTVGLFGPGSHHIFHAIGPRATAVSRSFPCSPCSMITCIRPQDSCMQAITVDDVMQETDRLLATHDRSDVADAPGALPRRGVV